VEEVKAARGPLSTPFQISEKLLRVEKLGQEYLSERGGGFISIKGYYHTVGGNIKM